MRRALLFCALFVSLSFALGALGASSPSPLPPTPPRTDAEAGPTKVGYVIWIGDITRIDSAAQTFSANLVIFLRWRDPQLAHAGPGTKQFLSTRSGTRASSSQTEPARSSAPCLRSST